MRRAAAVGLTGLALVALPVSARSDTAAAVAGGAAAGVGMGMVCSAVALTAGKSAGEGEFARRGWLVGVAGSYAIETFEDDAESDLRKVLGPSVSLSVDNSLGINGRAGYRCHRYFSAEVEVEWLDGFEADLSEAGLGKIATVDVEPLVVTVNAKGHLLTGRYQPFLLVGAGAVTAEAKVRDTAGLGLSASDSETEFAMRFGGGIDLYATKHVVVSVEADYVLPFGSLDDLDYISIGWGLQYRF